MAGKDDEKMRHTAEGNFMCILCGYQADDRGAVRLHWWNKHDPLRPRKGPKAPLPGGPAKAATDEAAKCPPHNWRALGRAGREGEARGKGYSMICVDCEEVE